MSRMRIIKGLTTERASLSASSTAGSLVAANMLTNEREAVWRATGKTATITLTWSALETIDAVALGWTNLTDAAQVTVKLYLNTGDATPTLTRTANPASNFPLGLLAWGPDSATSGVVKRASQVQMWLPTSSCRKVTIEISDTSNTANVEVGRLMVGRYYEMSLNAQYGASLSLIDRGRVSRTESSSVRREPDKILRKLSVSFPMASTDDSLALMELAAYGKGSAMFVSLAPDTSSDMHQTHAFFACLAEDYSQSVRFINRYETNLTFEEIG